VKKFAITVGQLADGKLVVLDGPSEDVGAQVDALVKLTNAGGAGKGKAVVADAVILHSTKGVIKKRKDMPGNAPAPATPDE